MNNEAIKAISKYVKNSVMDGGRELSPGEKGRRYEPTIGLKKHREHIHKESKLVDDNKNLPFSFSKPKKATRQKVARCQSCGSVKYVSVNTVGVICSQCNQYAAVEELNDD